MSALRLEKLSRQHAVETFDCGDDALNRYLRRFALPNQTAQAGQTYVALSDDAVIGYFTLVVGSVSHDDAEGRLRKGLARHPIPVMILARLAVARDWQGRGVGAGLLRDAVLRTFAAAEIAGIRALVVHAKTERAREFYLQHGFVPSPTDALHVYALLKDLA